MGIYKPNGDHTWIQINSQPIFLRGGVLPDAVVTSFLDISEARRAHDNLQESEQRFRLIAENLDAVFWLTTPDGSEMIYVSPHFERIWGRSCWSLFERPTSFLDYIHPDDYPHVARAQGEKVLGTYDVEYRMIRADGAIRWIRSRAYPIRDHNGQLWRVAGISEDITEHKRAAEALHQSEERYRTLVESAHDVIFTFATDGTILSLNSAFERALGWPRSQTIGRSLEYIIHPDDYLYAQGMVATALSDDTVVLEPFELRVKNVFGAYNHFETSLTSLKRDGHTISILGVARDITERRNAESALRDSETQNRALLNAIPDTILRITDDGIYSAYNWDTVGGLATRANQSGGQSLFKTLPFEVAHQLKSAIVMTLRTGTVQTREYQLMIDGDERDYEARFAVCGVNEVLAIVRDITEKKQIERMKNDFIAIVSHELRTPLTSIRGSLSLVASGVAGAIPPPVREMIQIAYNNSERLGRLINDMLDIEKIAAGKMVFHSRSTNLVELLGQVVESNRSLGHSTGIVLQLECEENALYVHVDPDRLTQAVTNLLSNAVKYSPSEGVVRLTLQKFGDLARIAVIDQGAGIPEYFRDRIFQKFAQADTSSTRKFSGTGLGLHITKAIVDVLGGTIYFESETGCGTTFYVDLPESLAPAELNEDAADHDKTDVGTPVPQILHVEDNSDIRSIVASIVSELADVTSAASLSEAQKHIERHAYDLYLIDLELPDGNGIELLDLIEKQKQRRAPVIVFSIREIDERIQSRVSAGLVKSMVTNEELLDAIQAALEKTQRLPDGDRVARRL